MSAETMITFLQNCTPEERLGFQVVTQCAPVLKGIKVSNLISAKAGTWKRIRRYLQGCRVICVLLYADAEKEVLFLYRYEMLERHLKNPQVREFLRRQGYEKLDVASVLLGLRRRYQRYAGANMEFPHELGVLLEYPVEDVEGFIANQGRNSLMAKYWKVYHNQERARQIFRLYDEAKERAMEEIIRGVPLVKVASSADFG